jgi:tripartite-type tricarboxylate transporter receptor subunit TctC
MSEEGRSQRVGQESWIAHEGDAVESRIIQISLADTPEKHTVNSWLYDLQHQKNQRTGRRASMRRHQTRCAILVAIAAAAFVAFTSVSYSAPYPERPVRLIVGFAAGGASDLVARILAQQLSEQMGQPVVVDNRSGAGGNIGADAVAKSSPDGYTLCLATGGTLSINPTLYAHISFDPIRDFAPISRVTEVPQVLIVNPSLPAHNVAEFIAYAKAQGSRLNYASGGSGTATHLAGEMFNAMAGVKMQHVAYRGTGPAMIDVLSGQVPVMFDQISTSMPLVTEGKLRALGVTSAERSPLAPDLPTISESGLPGYDVSTWHGLIAPAGTPKAVIERLNAEVVKALQSPLVRERFKTNGIVPISSTPEEFGELIKSELARWRDIIKASGATVD